ncbi:protein C19orf12 homolog [Bradysia coprophila]|uniref:protein C19orf12 homolog n=1 Tax=Bradysia coprophila TaxID=38358 RepID=UPI00187DAE42|nr:protein C19orf12 homolog [Bradysia coprophila]
MVLNTNELFDAIAILTQEQNMRVTVKQSAKGALICGASCFVGGLVAGPVGMAVGGTVGGISAWKMSQGQFKPVSEIIRNDLTARQKEKLMEHIMASVRDLDVTDAAILLPMLMGSASIQQAVLSSVVTFVGKELNLQMVN